MTPRIQTLLAFLAGIVVGTLTMVFVAFRAVDGAALLLSAELEQRAGRGADEAWCRKDYARGALHGWMQLQVAPGLRPVEFGGFPHTLSSIVGLSRLSVAAEPVSNPRADQRNLAFQRGLLAATLERAGLAELADEQWRLAERVFSEDDHSLGRERFAKANDDRCARIVTKPNR